MQVLRAILEAQPDGTRRDGAAGHQNHLTAPLAQRHQLLNQTVNDTLVEASPLSGQ
jgi:hypothetical protein